MTVFNKRKYPLAILSLQKSKIIYGNFSSDGDRSFPFTKKKKGAGGRTERGKGGGEQKQQQQQQQQQTDKCLEKWQSLVTNAKN